MLKAKDNGGKYSEALFYACAQVSLEQNISTKDGTDKLVLLKAKIVSK